MKKEKDEYDDLLWLIMVEDSSRWDPQDKDVGYEERDGKRIGRSVAKVFIYYCMALAITILLSRLH